MPGLLVSVRSAREACAAVAGGAAIVDIKEPARGPLGRADAEIWAEVRRALPSHVPLSVALGELDEALAWVEGLERSGGLKVCFQGVSYRKLGLAGAEPNWAVRWRTLREQIGSGPGWVAVAYADWQAARAPRPDAVLEEAVSADCAGLLIDTWDKAHSSPTRFADAAALIERAHGSGLFVALAGGLGEVDIARLQPLGVDLFAVRGAACVSGDRCAEIEPQRVARLVAAAKTHT